MFYYKWTGTLLGAGALSLRMVAVQFPQETERIYSRTIFPIIRQVTDMSISNLPFPSVYLFVAMVLGAMAYFFIQLKRRAGLKNRFSYFIRSLLNFSGCLIFFFLLLWGYNYQRTPVYQQLALDVAPLSYSELEDEVKLTHELLVKLREKLTTDTLAIEETIPYSSLEGKVRGEMKIILPLLGFVGNGQPRTREFYPAGFLRGMGILGIYFPFTGESYIDPTLHDLEKPFTVAHEMAHSWGITHEGEANLISWLAGTYSDDGLFQYSAQLQLFRYQLNDLYRRDREEYKRMVGRMDAGIKNDMISIMLRARKTPPLFGDLSRRSNDLYLKTQGVKAGVKSYTQLPALAYAWKKSKGLEGVLRSNTVSR